MVMKNKQISMKKGIAFAKGGNGKMLKGAATGPQEPGKTSQEHARTKSKTPPKGGNTKMFGKQTVKALKPE